VLVHAFDRDGRLVETDMADRAIALHLVPPRTCRVLAVAGGPAKHDAVRGALLAGLVDVLVTDRGCAEAALA
jgi:DNA-binding transcriptional regulator LsrR (DeoR family)